MMTERHDMLRAGEYFLAVQGFAMMRTCVTHPSIARQRVVDMRRVLDHFDEFPAYAAYPDATRAAFLGLPYLVIWRVTKPV